MKTGILGGTFNPIHLAHLRIAEEIRETCALDRIVFIPAATPPHKPMEGELSFAHRLAMVQTATADNPYFSVSDIESRRNGKSYSVQTLEILKDQYPEDEFYFIIGLDSFRDIATWREYQRIFQLTNIVVATRPGIFDGDPKNLLPVAIAGEFCYDCASKQMVHQCGTRLIFQEETLLDISSTNIRHLIRKNRSIRYLTHAAVAAYIEKHGLYR